MRAAQPLFTAFAEAPRVAEMGVETATLLGFDQSGGRSDVREIRCEPGSRVDSVGDVATHRYVQVLDGAWEMALGDRRTACAAGTTLVAPRGIDCGGIVSGSQAGRLLVLSFPV